MLGPFLDKEIERIDHRHVGNQIDADVDLPGRLRECQPGDKIAVGILLPVDEMLLGPDLERVADDRCARMRGRAQTDFMRGGDHRAIKAIVGLMMQGNANGHGELGRWGPPAVAPVQSGNVIVGRLVTQPFGIGQ